MVARINFDTAYLNELIQFSAEEEVTCPTYEKTGVEYLYEIANFQHATLAFYIANLEFEIN